VKYLFDTDLISTLMKGKASSRLLARLASVGAGNQGDLLDYRAGSCLRRIRAEREAAGRLIAPEDLQIAATALASGRILVT
jgi:predicted nucleic acid-binding protein